MNRIHRDDRAIGDIATRSRNSPVVEVAGAASDIADQWQLFSACMLTAGLGLMWRNPKLTGTGARMTLAMLTATALKNMIKSRVDRTRPYVVADGGEYVFKPGCSEAPELCSFPSGHTAGIVGVARTVARAYPGVSIGAASAAISVALAQVPRGKHYPTDLLAGTVIGVTADLMVSEGWKVGRRLLASRLQRRNLVADTVEHGAL